MKNKFSKQFDMNIKQSLFLECINIMFIFLDTGCYDLVKNHIFEKSTKVPSQLDNLNNTSKSLEKNKRLE